MGTSGKKRKKVERKCKWFWTVIIICECVLKPRENEYNEYSEGKKVFWDQLKYWTW